jgi:hypothetical protein
MSDSPGLFGRFSRWLRRQWRQEEDLPLLYGQTETATLGARRGLFPWTRASASIDLVESRLSAVTALMVALRNAIDQQAQRHDELLNYLSQLSQALQAIPDTSRVQSEMLRVLHQQIAYQNAQHKQLSEVLRKLSESDSQQHDIVEGLRERVESVYQADQLISTTVSTMDTAVKQMSLNSDTTALVLQRLRDNLVNHETELDRSIRRQNRLVLVALGLCLAVGVVAALMVMSIGSRTTRAIDELRQSPPVLQQPAPLPAPAAVLTPASLPATQPTTSPAPIERAAPPATAPTTTAPVTEATPAAELPTIPAPARRGEIMETR